MDERILKHIGEFRRLILIFFALYLLAYFVLLFFFPRIYSFIVSSIGARVSSVYAFGIGDIVGFYFVAPAIIALLTTFPLIAILFYQWAKDALFPEEKRFVVRCAQSSAVFFLLGVFLSFFLVPRLVDLSTYLGELLGVTVIYSAREIFNIWLTLAVVLGIVFQFPIILSLLIRMGFVSKDTLRSARFYVYPIFYIVSAIITPGDLLITDVILLFIFVILYEGTIAFTREKR